MINATALKKTAPFALLVILSLLYVSLIARTLYIDPESNIRTTTKGYGDIPFHLAETVYFSHPIEYLQEPIFLGEKFQYPFGINLLSGMLLKATDSLRFSFLLPVLALGILNIFLLFAFFRRFAKNSYLAIFGIFLFFFACGLNAYPMVQNAFKGNTSFREEINTLVQNNDSIMVIFGQTYPKQNIAYGPPLHMFFMHQRAFIAGLTLFLALFLSLLSLLENRKKRFFALSILSYGLLPIFHMHTFVAATVALFIFALIALTKKNWGNLKAILLVAIAGGIIALPQVLFLISPKIYPSAITFPQLRLIWMSEDSFAGIQFPPDKNFALKEFLKYQWFNFGLLIPAFILSGILFFKRNLKNILHPHLLTLFISSVSLIFLVNILQFQPWDFDNNKLLLYSHFLFLPSFLVLLQWLYRKAKMLSVILGIIFALIALSGGIIETVISLKKDKDELPVIFEKEKVELGEFIDKNIPLGSVIATGTSHLNPIVSLSGRPVLVGYQGWLWTRGINYSPRLEDLKNFYINPKEGQEFIEKYDVDYIFLDEETAREFGADKEKFDSIFDLMYESEKMQLYSTKK